MAVTQYYGTGRRKSSTARVFLRPGTGQITINAKAIADAVNTESLRLQVRSPLVLTETLDKFDIVATTSGGGISGMAGALRLGIARALIELDPELRPALKKLGFLTRDPREKESKKYGLKKARKAPQYSKR